MQPFEKASEESRRRHELPYTYAKAGASALGGGIALNRVLPLLSSHVPEDLAIKGLSKIDPRFGKFIKKGIGMGFDYNEIRDFMSEKVQGEEGQEQQESKQEPAKEGRNIIQQYSPELFQFLEQLIKRGRSPVEAGAIAQNNKYFSKSIKQMMKDHKTNWSDIVQSIFGNGQTAQPQQAQQQPQGMGQPQQEQQQGGPGQQQMMAILQKINQRLGQGQ